ncbi:MAG: hypothetical protein ABI146_08225 [Nitrobacter sp.]|jgi:hypothetical protein
MEIKIATRYYADYCPLTKTEYPIIDRMVRRGRQFFLIEGPARPGESEIEKRYTLRQVFEWLQELPEQIERAVFQARPINRRVQFDQ